MVGAVIYVRVSTKEQTENLSLPTQLRACEEYCRRQGYEIGYLNAPRAMGKSLMADLERAPLVRRAFEEYATGRYTKEQLLKQARVWGLTNRRGRPLTSQAIGMLLRNQLYAGIVDVPEYGVRAKRGDFEPLISEELFYRVQSVLSGRMPITTPQQRAHPDFPRYLRPIEAGNEGVVDQIFASWNPLISWLRTIQGLQSAA
jgi:hypothetical protein